MFCFTFQLISYVEPAADIPENTVIREDELRIFGAPSDLTAPKDLPMLSQAARDAVRSFEVSRDAVRSEKLGTPSKPTVSINAPRDAVRSEGLDTENEGT